MTVPISSMGLFPAAVKYCTEKQEALSRVLKTTSLSCRWINAVIENSGKSRLSLLDDVDFSAGHGRKFLGFTCLPKLLTGAHKAVQTARTNKYVRESVERMVEDVSDAASATLSALGLVLSRFSRTAVLCKPIRAVSELTSAASDIASAAINVEKGLKVHSQMAQASDLEKVQLKEDQTTYLLKSVSKVAAIASAIFGAIAFATGASIISVVTALSISWLAATVGLAGKIWETSLDRKPIE